jgi:putative transposase
VSYGFVHDHVALFPVQLMCEVLGVSRSGYYDWVSRPESARAAEDRGLAAEIRASHEGSRGRYGSPRVHAELRAHGRRVGRKRVARLMRGMGLAARRKRRFRRTTDSAHALPVAPNLLGRDFAAAAPDRVWLADLTYIWTAEGWLYLAVVLDLFSRRVVGWAMADHLGHELALAALDMAIARRRPAAGLVHHSDRGVQGGFKRSSQHLGGGGCDEDGETALGSGTTNRVAAVAWPAGRGSAREPPSVLGGYRVGPVERGGCG